MQYGPDRKRVRSRTRKPSEGHAWTVLPASWDTLPSCGKPMPSESDVVKGCVRIRDHAVEDEADRRAERGAVDRPGGGDPALLRRPPLRRWGSPRSPGRPACPRARRTGCCTPMTHNRLLAPERPTGATGPARCWCSSVRSGARPDDAAGRGPAVHGGAARRGRRDRRACTSCCPRASGSWSTRWRAARSCAAPTPTSASRSRCRTARPGKAILSVAALEPAAAVLARADRAVTAHTVTDPDRLRRRARRRPAARLGRLRMPSARPASAPWRRRSSTTPARSSAPSASRCRACGWTTSAPTSSGSVAPTWRGRSARAWARRAMRSTCTLERRLPARRVEQAAAGPGPARPRHPRRRGAPARRRPHRDGVPPGSVSSRSRETNASPSRVRSWSSRGSQIASSASRLSSAHSVVPLNARIRPAFGTSMASTTMSLTTNTSSSRSRSGTMNRSPLAGLQCHARPPQRPGQSRCQHGSSVRESVLGALRPVHWTHEPAERPQPGGPRASSRRDGQGRASSTCWSSAAGSSASAPPSTPSTRGLSTGLVEQRDLASGTSSRSSKLIHGGLRYLEMLDFGLVKEALEERGLLLTRLAPHLVRPVPFLYPLHRGWERPYVGAGLALYDSMAMLGKYEMGVPRHRHLFRRQVARIAPDLRTEKLHRRDPLLRLPGRRRPARGHRPAPPPPTARTSPPARR